MLRNFSGMCYPVVCVVEGPEVDGLHSDHSYSLISAREVIVHRRALRMVVLRSPFGASGWRGRWSNASCTWERNPAARRALHFKPLRDGTFWSTFGLSMLSRSLCPFRVATK